MHTFSKSILLVVFIVQFQSAVIAQAEIDSTAQSSFFYTIKEDVRIRDLFGFIDSTVAFLQPTLPYQLTEHLLLRANPRLISDLENTDYYAMKTRTGLSVYDHGGLVILNKNDSLRIPSPDEAEQISALQATTQIDVNLPEFRLRIIENGDTVFACPIRIGQNRNRFLEAAGRDIDLRTKTGRGQIAVLHRDLVHVDPVSGEIYTHTNRDDAVTTRMPFIPWIEPRINGQLNGQWIHPTTNPRTLEKPYSNGCMGLREGDAWRVYSFSPIGTSVVIRYDLEIPDGQGGTVFLPDVYFREPEQFLPMQAAENIGGDYEAKN